MISTYNILESNQAAKLSAVDEALLYTFKIHYSYFNLFGLFVSQAFVGAKIMTSIGTRLMLTRSLDIKETFMWSEEPFCHKPTMPEEFVENNEIISDAPNPTLEKMTAYREKYMKNVDGEKMAKNVETYSSHISNKEECMKYVERTSLNPTTKTIAFVAGAIAIVAGVCQVIVAEALDQIPADKVGVVMKLQGQYNT
jgi:hypothetical protein